MRTAVNTVRAQSELKDYDKSMESYRAAPSIIDRMQSKGKIHKNTAARLKSRLNTAIKALIVAA